MAEPGMVVQLSVAELRSLLRAEVRSALREHAGATLEPVLLDRQQLAHALGVSVPTVDRLRDQGCPSIRVQQAVRFELDAVIGWLKSRRPELRVVR